MSIMNQEFGQAGDDIERSRLQRERRIQDMMSHVIYPDNVGRKGLCVDKPWASTIAEATNFTFDESDVPADMKNMICADVSIDLMLKERHIADVVRYAQTGTVSHSSSLNNMGITTVAGHEFKESMDAQAFGYSWYRKYNIALPAGSLILLKPMLQPWVVGGSPFPRAYASPDSDEHEVSGVVAELCIM